MQRNHALIELMLFKLFKISTNCIKIDLRQTGFKNGRFTVADHSGRAV
jgi:hypothetical protein